MHLLWKVGEKHHAVLFPNMPAFEIIFGGQLKLLQEAVRNGKFFVEAAANDEILADQKVAKESKEYAAMMAPVIARSQQATARAYQQAYSGINSSVGGYHYQYAQSMSTGQQVLALKPNYDHTPYTY